MLVSWLSKLKNLFIVIMIFIIESNNTWGVTGSVLDHRNKASITLNLVMQNFCFPNVFKSYVYTTL